MTAQKSRVSAPDAATGASARAGQPARFRLRTDVYRDPSIFAAEMERIFESTWVYVCHESELPEVGDYRTRAIGRQPVIITRSSDGAVRAFLNICRHRGAAICREDRGNANYFRCPYHGWAYSNDGRRVGIAQRREGYPDSFGSDELLTLLPVAQLDSYRGLYFASLNADSPPLMEHLGGAARYIDRWSMRAPEGIEVVDPPHRYRYSGNWKMQSENGADGYHGNYVHESFFQTLEHFGERKISEAQDFREAGCTRAFTRGHAVLERPGPTQGNPIDGKSHSAAFARYYDLLVGHHGEELVEDVLMQRNILIFPNLYLFDRHIRMIEPRSAGETDVLAYYFRIRGTDDELDTERLWEHQRFFGTAGFGTPDDVEIFAAVDAGAKAAALDWLILERGIGTEERRSGELVGHSTSETPQRAMYLEWQRLMGGNWAEISDGYGVPS